MFENIANKLKLGKHYKIERFGVMFVSLFLLLVCCVGVCLRADMVRNNEVRAAQAVYTTEFATSRTGVSGKVIDVYKSEDGKGCMVLLKFDDITKVSTDAKNYQMFLTSAFVSGNPLYMSYAPSGSIYMFGSSGYMGIYLYSATGFGTEILDLVVRCNSELVPVQGANAVGDDASFAKYDQFRVYFNPSGTNAAVVSCLNDNDFTLFEVYEELICREREQSIRLTLQTDLKQLYADLNLIAEYENRFGLIGIDGATMVVPERPVGILGDSVTIDENGKYIYHCEQVVPRGVNFDWEAGSIKDGYSDSVIPEGMSYTSWISQLNKETGNVRLPKADDWFLSDGTAWVDYNTQDTIGPVKDMNTTISLLTNAYKSYYEHKKDYQIDHLRSLLLLELEARNVESYYTINTSEDVLIIY